MWAPWRSLVLNFQTSLVTADVDHWVFDVIDDELKGQIRLSDDPPLR